MSILDKAIAAVTPPESDQDRAEARAKARSVAVPGDWLSLILEHHLQIESAFSQVESTGDVASRRAAQKRLAIILTGHSNAEESVIYPALIQCGEKGHAGMAYTEQQAAKVQAAELEQLDPMSADFHDKLEHLKGAVLHHVYEEEGTWFPELKDKASATDQTLLTRRYEEEFERYMGADEERFATRRPATGRDPLATASAIRQNAQQDPSIRN